MLPRENLYRAVMPGAELRAAESADGMPTMTGHFAVFNTPTEINSAFEGRFLERIAPGAFAKSIAERVDAVKVLFNHGHDPSIGDKPLGSIDVLREDETGAYYEVGLLDASYVRDLVPALKAGLLGASFRFKVMRESVVDKPKRSAGNPDGIPERTITEAKLYEFGPVTFPAYAAATAGVRSITDLVHDVDAVIRATPILLDEERTAQARIFLTRPLPDLSAAADERGETDSTTAPPDTSAEKAPEPTHPARGRRVPTDKLYGQKKDKPSWQL